MNFLLERKPCGPAVNTLGVVLLDGEVFWCACNAVTARLFQDGHHAVLGGHHEAGTNTEKLF
jgi:hypothetical protein